MFNMRSCWSLDSPANLDGFENADFPKTAMIVIGMF